MTSYRIEFERIGRTRTVPPLEVFGVDSPHDNQVLAAIAHHGRPYLGSETVQAWVNAPELRGYFEIGVVRSGGTFTLTEIEDRRCVVCGCTDSDATDCIAATGERCWWLDIGRASALCSRCA